MDAVLSSKSSTNNQRKKQLEGKKRKLTSTPKMQVKMEKTKMDKTKGRNEQEDVAEEGSGGCGSRFFI